jgi:hypothetical protein
MFVELPRERDARPYIARTLRIDFVIRAKSVELPHERDARAYN